MQKVFAKFEKINLKGETLGKTKENKKVKAFGVLPKEKAKIILEKKKKGIFSAQILEILEKSPLRTLPKEKHFLSCSPWQIMRYSYQICLKKEILKRAFQKMANESIFLADFFEAKNLWHYRTKMEFSFKEEKGKLFLAFFERGKKNKKIALLKGCKLAGKLTNKIALLILKKLRDLKISERQLKSLILRESKFKNELLAILFLKEKKNLPLNLKEIPGLSGLIIVFSDPKSPACVFTQILKKEGKLFLEEKILNLKIAYPFDAFFQNNIPLFEKALLKMGEFLEGKEKILELYSGVGTIGLFLSQKAKWVKAVEILPTAVKFAKLNAKANKIKNYFPILARAEKIPFSFFQGIEILVLDPPRPGLSPKLIKFILKSLPKKIIYLSCNPLSLAKDFSLLKKSYFPLYLAGFDFYPHTPHLEALLFLERKS